VTPGGKIQLEVEVIFKKLIDAFASPKHEVMVSLQVVNPS
jgi:hypothetical protein